MKNFKTRSVISFIVLFLSICSAWAKEDSYSQKRGLRNPQSESSISESSSYGLGFSTVINPGLTQLRGNGTSVTALFNLGGPNMIQAFLTFPDTRPFNLGGMALYKRTIVGSRAVGLHIGGGLGIANYNGGGAAGSILELNLAAIGGFHFEIPGIPQIVVHIDGGPQFVMFTSNPTITTFSVQSLSSSLGLSLIYML